MKIIISIIATQKFEHKNMHNKNLTNLFTILLFLLIGQAVFSQNTLRGTVFDETSGEPIGFCNVFLANTSIGVNTSIDGFYSITQIPDGTYDLMATFIGYDTASVQVTLEGNEVITQQLFLKESGVQIKEVSISAEREIAKSEVQVSTLTISPKQITMLPSTGGEPDILQYLQVIPGVISTGDAGGQIFIRGGSPVQNKILLDGLTIFNPFHSIGFFSTFETDAIRSVDVLTGGFNAEHGGRISAIVDINTKDGNKKKLSGSVSASPFMAKAFLEGPLVKQTEYGGSTSFILSHKRSYIDQTGTFLYPYAALSDSIGLPYSLNDTYGKVSFINKNGSHLSLFGFNYLDRFDNPAVASINWRNSGGGANFRLLLDNSDLVLNGLVGFTNYNIGFSQDNGDDPRNSSVGNFVGRFDFDYFLPKGTFKYGVEVNILNTDFNFTNPFGLTISETQSSPDISGFAKLRYKFGNLVIEPGFRGIFYSALSEFSAEPRIGLKYNITEGLRFKAAGGLYSQNLLATSNEQDVIVLFNGFLTSPEDQILELGTSTRTTSNLQKSTHAIAGLEIDLMPGMTLNLESYFKRFDQLIVVNRNKISPDTPNFSTESGDAFGGDVTIKYQLPNLYLWATYAIGYVNRFDGFQVFPTIFDRRHNINFLANYQFGNNNSWEFGARWNFGTGFPFTQTAAFYNLNNFEDGVETNIITENPEDIGVLFSETRNGGRLPTYHRLDFSLIKRIELSESGKVEINASVTNAYNRGNIFFFDRISFERVNQLPILPSVSVKYSF